jgi:calmodulin
LKAKELTPEQDAQIKEIFNIFDKDRNGCISTSELENVLKALGKNPTQADVDEIVSLMTRFCFSFG